MNQLISASNQQGSQGIEERISEEVLWIHFLRLLHDNDELINEYYLNEKDNKIT